MASSLDFSKLNKTTTFTTTPPSIHSNQWTTEQTQQIYATNLIHALRNSPPSTSSAVEGKRVRQTADRVLAVAAKGTMRWSRAILTGPQSAGAQIMKKHKKTKLLAAGRRLSRSAIAYKEKRKLTVVEKKFKVLGRIVPGCNKLSYSNILDETSDYITALEMQVRAMTAITQFVSGGDNGEAQPPADWIGSNVVDS